MAGPIRISILANASQARREMNRVAADTATLGDKFSKFGRYAAAGLAVAGVAAVKFGIDSVKAASDAEQSVGAVESIYGKFASSVEKNAARAADAVGLSASAYRNASALIGAQFKNQGVALDRLAGKTDQMIGVAADLAATFGGTTQEAVESLSSAFKGEFDPLEKYGIGLKQVDINAEAARLAQDKYGKSLESLSDAQQKSTKQQATTNLILGQGKDALGAFARESDTLAGKQQRLAAKFEDVQAKIGTALLPILIDLADWVDGNVIPALEDLAEWMGKNSDEIGDTASKISSTVLPVLKQLADITMDLAGFFAGLPGPVKMLAVEMGFLALVLPRVSAAMTATRNSATGMVTAFKDAERRSAMLGRGIQVLAGTAGLYALQKGAEDGNEAVTALGGALTGAAAGAAIGSVFPGVGTAIGAVGGAAVGAGISLWQMNDAQKAAGESAEQAKPKFTDWTSTLDQATGAITRNTRALALQKLQQDGVIGQAAQLGINTRDLIGSMLGQEGAMKRVNNAMRGNTDILKGLSYEKLNKFLYDNRSALRAQQTQLRQNNTDLKTWGQALRNVPKEVRTRLRQLDFEPSMKQVRALRKQYDLTPKQVRTIIRETGVDPVRKKVRGLGDDLKNAGKTKANVEPWLRSWTSALTDAEQRTKRGTDDINGALKDGTGKARANLGPFAQDFSSKVTGLRGTATEGGSGIGSNLGSGINSGISGWVSTIAATAARAVATAIQAARNEAQIKSPSRKTKKIGQQLMQGLVIGVQRGTAGVKAATEKVMGIIEKVLDRRFDGKKLNRKVREYSKWLKANTKRLTENAKRQDKVNARLTKARDALRNIKGEYKALKTSVKDQTISFANITGFDVAFTPKAIAAEMKKRLEKIRQFTAVVQDLIARGLNQTTVNQLISAGVEGGLAYALALQAGGPATVAEINDLQGQVNSAAGILGTTAADDMYAAGIRAAEGLVKGLEAQQKAIDAVARRLARKLVAAVKKELGIKSPSKVFADLGKQTVLGLEIGLRDTTGVVKASSALGDLITNSFSATPATELYAASSLDKSAPAPANYYITVNAPVGSNPKEIGRTLVSYIDAYEKSGGRRAS